MSLSLSLRGRQPPSVTGTYAIETMMLTRTTWQETSAPLGGPDTTDETTTSTAAVDLYSILKRALYYYPIENQDRIRKGYYVLEWISVSFLHYVILIGNISRMFCNKNATAARILALFINLKVSTKMTNSELIYWRPRTVAARNSGCRFTNAEKWIFNLDEACVHVCT